MQPSSSKSDDASRDANTNWARKSTTKVERRLVLENLKFLDDFDAEKSSTEQRKLTKQSSVVMKQPVVAKAKSIFDERGRYKHNNADVCDCLEDDCPGCHFPCPNCSSEKCGPVCRVNRTWAFQTAEDERGAWVIHNKNAKS